MLLMAVVRAVCGVVLLTDAAAWANLFPADPR